MTKKKKTILCIIVVLAINVVAFGAIGIYHFLSPGVTEAGLDPLEEDPGNVPEDDWTARY